jgi:heme/copper-type cytochrome/quinol oxidase subunit 4
MFLPIISILNTSYLTYFHSEEFKEGVKLTKNEKIKMYLSIILTTIAILVLSSFVERKMGKLFQILVIALGFVLIKPNQIQFQDRLFYFMAVAAVVGIYIYTNKYIRGGLVALCAIVIITLEILEYLHKEKKIKHTSNLRCFLEALLMTSLILIWSEYGKAPKYIKIFLRR